MNLNADMLPAEELRRARPPRPRPPPEPTSLWCQTWAMSANPNALDFTMKFGNSTRRGGPGRLQKKPLKKENSPAAESGGVLRT